MGRLRCLDQFMISVIEKGELQGKQNSIDWLLD